MDEAEVTIGRLTLQLPHRPGASDRAQEAQALVARLLGELQWRPAGYRPGQVWVIRRLTALPPLPPALLGTAGTGAGGAGRGGGGSGGGGGSSGGGTGAGGAGSGYGASGAAVRRGWTQANQAGSPAGPPQAPGAWLAEVEDALAEVYRRALRLRPAAAPAAWGALASAESVLFEDRADWLALLTAATLGGRVWTDWCWAEARAQAGAVGQDAGTLLGALWSREAAYLPPALGLLAPAEARAAVGLLPPREVSRVVRALHTRFGLPDDVLRVTAPELPITLALAPGTAPWAVAAPGTAPWAVAAPWAAWVPAAARGGGGEELGGLGPQAHYLYGLAAVLRQAPGAARSPHFAADAAAWLRAALLRRQQELAAGAQGDGRQGGTGMEEAPRPLRVMGQPALRRQEPAARPGQGAGQGPGPGSNFGAGPRSRSGPGLGPARGTSQQSAQAPGCEGAVAEQHISRAQAEEQAVGVQAPRRWDGEANSALCGVLFLIPALAWLDLPGDAGERIGPWALVEVCARALLYGGADRGADRGAAGDADRDADGHADGHADRDAAEGVADWAADPIWEMLRGLDGRREGVLIGAGYVASGAGYAASGAGYTASGAGYAASGAGPGWQVRPDEGFRLAPRVVSRYLRGPWQGEVRDGRLRLARGGVPVLDVPPSPGDEQEAVAEALREYAGERAAVEAAAAANVAAGDAAAGDAAAGDVAAGDAAAAGETAGAGETRGAARFHANAGETVEWALIPAGAEESRVRAALAGMATPAVQWYAARVLVCLLHLLRRALGDAELPAEEVERRVLRQVGRVEITRTHVDVFLPLASADVQLRRAGLDRNPGWAPEYGYIVTVHYE